MTGSVAAGKRRCELDQMNKNTDEQKRSISRPKEKRPGILREFMDFMMLFSGISTQSNLSRTQTKPVGSRGMFLFRRGKGK